MGVENLIVATPAEIESFLVEGRLERMRELLGPCRVVDGEGMAETRWRALLRECDPEVVVAGWTAPALPCAELSSVAPSLRYLCYLPGSVRRIVSREAIEDGLLVTNWGSSISRTVAECALLLTLSCLRRTVYWNEQMHSRNGWKTCETETLSLFDRRVGIHGYGAVARELLPLIRPFTRRVSVYAEGVPRALIEDAELVRMESLEALFAGSDVVVELESLTPERRGVVTEDLLRRLPRGGVFVNVARGALADETALLRVAREGRIQIGLDVFEKEPLPVDHPFRGCPNMTLFPHLAGPTTDRRKDAADFALQNLERYFRGEQLEALITPEVYDRIT